MGPKLCLTLLLTFCRMVLFQVCLSGEDLSNQLVDILEKHSSIALVYHSYCLYVQILPLLLQSHHFINQKFIDCEWKRRDIHFCLSPSMLFTLLYLKCILHPLHMDPKVSCHTVQDRKTVFRCYLVSSSNFCTNLCLSIWICSKPLYSIGFPNSLSQSNFKYQDQRTDLSHLVCKGEEERL